MTRGMSVDCADPERNQLFDSCEMLPRGPEGRPRVVRNISPEDSTCLSAGAHSLRQRSRWPARPHSRPRARASIWPFCLIGPPLIRSAEASILRYSA